MRGFISDEYRRHEAETRRQEREKREAVRRASAGVSVPPKQTGEPSPISYAALFGDTPR